MMFFEILAPRGALDKNQRQQLGTSLLDELFDGTSAPAEVLAAGRALAHVVIHEPQSWTPGDRSAAPHYLVRVSVPEAWREETSRHLISKITRVVADLDPDPDGIADSPRVWVHVIGIPEGSYGTMGRAHHSKDLVRMITRPFREADPATRARQAPAGSTIDPICGMTVPLTQATITLLHEGTTYAFCSTGCREVFTDDHADSRPAPADPTR